MSSRISSKMEWQTAGDATRETELVALWGEPFDHLTRQAVDDFGSFPRLGGCAYSPLRVAKLGRSYQASALDANLKGTVGARPPNILLRHSGAVRPATGHVMAGAGKGFLRRSMASITPRQVAAVRYAKILLLPYRVSGR